MIYDAILKDKKIYKTFNVVLFPNLYLHFEIYSS
jgi:hypothetical protein